MTISCCVCGTVVGDILPGSKMKKGTAHLCDRCNTKRLAGDMMEKNDPMGFLKKKMMDANPGAKNRA